MRLPGQREASLVNRVRERFAAFAAYRARGLPE